MIDADRLDELATYRPDDDTPDDAKVRIPVGDLRDLVALIPVVRAAIEYDYAIAIDRDAGSDIIRALRTMRGGA